MSFDLHQIGFIIGVAILMWVWGYIAGRSQKNAR